MNCPGCKQKYNSKRVPRVLIYCGHTLCQVCLIENHNNTQIKCFDCCIVNFGKIESFPKNLTLLSIHEDNDTELCKLHHKKYEGYCERDKQLLCVACIFAETHKNHQVSPISETVLRDKEILHKANHKIQTHIQAYNEIKSNIQQVQNKMRYNYQVCLSDIEQFYSNLKQAINQREYHTKEKAFEILQREMEKLEEIKEGINDKHKFLQDLLTIYHEVIHLKELDYLNSSGKRVFIVENSQTRLPKIDLQVPMINFYKSDQIRKIQTYLQELFDAQREKSARLRNMKKKSTKQDLKKQPVVLQLNLNDRYIEMKKEKEKKIQSFEEEKCNISQIGMKSSHHSSVYNSLDDLLRNSKDASLSIRDRQYSIHNFSAKVYHLGGYGLNTIQSYDLERLNTRCTNICLDRVKFQSVFIPKNNKILILGGKKKITGERLQSCLVFDYQQEILVQSNIKLSVPKSGFGAIFKNDSLYLVGGSDSKNILNIVQQYSLRQMKMRKVAPMIYYRDQLSVVVGYDGYLYAIGGISSKGILNSCERYDFQKNKWQTIGNMHTPRKSFALVSLPDGLYAIGGHDGKTHLNSMQKYDFMQNKWKDLSCMIHGRCSHTAVATFDYQNILVFGGFDKSGLRSTQIYSIYEDKWQQLHDMVSQRYMHTSIIIKNPT